MSAKTSPSGDNIILDQTLGPDGLHQHACVLCTQRKVKCDRLDPSCSNCQKSKADCVYRMPAPPRRRKRKLSEPLLQSRLKKCEELLEKHGIPLGDMVMDSPATTATAEGTSASSGITSSPYSTYGKIVDGAGKVRDVYSRNDLWDDLKEVRMQVQIPLQTTEQDQVQPPKSSDDVTNGYDDETASSTADGESKDPGHGSDWLWGASTPGEFELQFPLPYICQILWQTYQENVHPVMMIIHVPTVTELITKLERSPEDLSRGERALVFSIFATAVNSMGEEDCENLFGDDKSDVLQRYRVATRQALASAKFLSTTNLIVLQALATLLLSMRTDCDPPTLWSLSGIAVRVGQRMGVHRTGADPSLSPFEGEMRRRLWFQIAILDAQTAELTGVGIPWDQIIVDSKVPLNVNDEDLHPDMKELPPEAEGATEMMHTLIRYEFGLAMRKMGFLTNQGDPERTGADVMAEKDLAIDALEQRFGRKYLRFCDPVNPLHFMTTLTARCMICRARFMAHHPKHLPDKGASMSQEERDKLFTLALKTIEYESLAHVTKNLRGFLWHIKNQIQFTALIFVLSELRQRKSGPIVEKAWDQVAEIYKNHPELIREKQRPLYWALGSLVVKAWEGRETDHLRFFDTTLQTPLFIAQLRAQRDKTSSAKTPKSQEQINDNPSLNVVPSSIYPNGPSPFTVPSESFIADPLTAYDFGGDVNNQFNMGFDPMGYSPLDWAAWDDMLRDFEQQAAQGFLADPTR